MPASMFFGSRQLTRGSFCRLMSSASKPVTVLRFGPIRFGQAAWDDLEKKTGAKVVGTEAKGRDEFLKELRAGKFADVDFVARTFESVNQTGLFDEELIAEFKKYTQLKAIAHNGAGYDQVDAVECGKQGIQVSNVPGLVDAPTANTHVYLILAALGNFQRSAFAMREGKWETAKCAGTPIGHDPDGRVLGILGMGGIGRALRDRMKPFGLKKVVYYNRHRLSPELEDGAEYCATPEELYAQADIVSISVPLNNNTKHMINKESIAKMKDGVVIVNTARGAVVNEAELIPALKSGKVASYGSDVWENEPHANKEIYMLPNVVCLPHMGTNTEETMKKMEEYVVMNVATYISSGKVYSIVPELKNTQF